MSKQNKRRNNRVRNLIVIFSLTAVIISVSTYAWFIGMRTVNVSSFDVEIAGTDSLLLSLNGTKWDSTLTFTQADLNGQSYLGNTNSWGGTGLVPMSSIGEMDNDASRMKLFEKASLTATAGGYRLMASRVDNYNENQSEQNGYVAFDLFIKNFSGTQYIAELNTADEEAIYLTTDSKVDVDVDGGGVANTGIENSVRVAFAQIGRVAGTTTDGTTITGITCSDNGSVTGICRTAKIWEPNDTKHVANAISWYTTSCTKRTGADVYTSREEAEHNCGTVIDGTTYPTYAIKKAISSGEKVDIYDGESYNGYAASVTNGFLESYEYFTDSKKMQTGTNRPEFMTLAPNSITKVRVYVYIEGQDIDNYDFASIGKKISVKFGFTKERFTEDDVDYTDPSLEQGTDMVKPVITLKGESEVTTAVGSTYEDAGATANDNLQGDISSSIVTTSDVDTSKAGTYTITYNVKDWAGNVADTVTRTVVVE